MSGSEPPRLTVITPTRNYGRFLPACLQSVAGQERTDVEHIVIDGASTDDTVALLRQWEGPGRTWLSEPDVNQSDALNKGLARARGEWVCWLNADEFYLPGALGRVMGRMTPDADLVSGDYVEVAADGGLVRLLTQHRYSRRVLQWYGPYLPSCATFFRRALVPPEGFDLGLRLAMDWDLWLRMTGAGGRVVYQPSAVAAFTLHDDSLTGAGLGRHHPELQELRRRHGLPTGAATGAFWWLARAERLVHKRINGNTRRALGARPFVGADLRWSVHAEALTAATAVAAL